MKSSLPVLLVRLGIEQLCVCKGGGTSFERQIGLLWQVVPAEATIDGGDLSGRAIQRRPTPPATWQTGKFRAPNLSPVMLCASDPLCHGGAARGKVAKAR